LREGADPGAAHRTVPAGVTVALLIVLPFGLPAAWVLGVAVLCVERPRGWRATMAMSLGGLRLPLVLYSLTVDHSLPPALGYPLAALSLVGCLVATHRLLSR
jgi:hypothetical protein